jgi:hypothetical protein
MGYECVGGDSCGLWQKVKLNYRVTIFPEYRLFVLLPMTVSPFRLIA